MSEYMESIMGNLPSEGEYIEAGGKLPDSICSAIEGVKISHEYGYLCFRTEKGWLLWSSKSEDMSESGESLESIINNFSPQNKEIVTKRSDV